MSGRLSTAIAVLVLAARAAAGSVYFVATNGNNALDGLSRTSAWRTLQRAIDGAGPGDTIRMMSGTYSGAAIRVSGTAAAPMTLRADDGADVTLNARGPGNWHSSVLELEIGGTNPVAHWTIEGLRVVNSGRYGIDARIAHHLQIRSNRVFNSVSTGIFTAFCYDTVIEGNESASNGEHGIYYNNSGDRFAIRNNRLHHNTACGLQLNADASITNNPALDDGIIADGVIENNVIYLNGPGGAGINLDGVVGAIVRNNLLYNTPNNSGIALFKGNGAVPSSTNQILNNTILMTAGGGWGINLSHPQCRSNTLRNNIVHSSHSFRGSIVLATSAPAGFSSDYNGVMDRFSIDGGGSVITLAAWRALGYDAQAVLVTPTALFVNPAGDFHLKTNSPAIDRGGVLAAVTNDADGIARPLDGDNDGGARRDIGAYEYVHPAADSDRDQMPDAAEIAAGTDPVNLLSRLQMRAVVAAGTNLVLCWDSTPGRVYAIGRSAALPSGFSLVASNLTASPPMNVWTGASDALPACYRVSLDGP